MFSCVRSHGLSGLTGFSVRVETDVSNGLPAFDVVGLPDAAVKESRERVRAAMKNAGYVFPAARITVNLSPADMRKEGSVYDLPIAVSLLAASGQLSPIGLMDTVFLGELALDGTVQPIAGILPMVIDATSSGAARFAVPSGNAEEAACAGSAEVLPVSTLRALVEHLSGIAPIQPAVSKPWRRDELTYGADFAEIKGQQGAKRAAEVAVAGGHNLLLIGTPGSGKTMLARSIPSILPELTYEEALEITKIHSLVGATKGCGLVRERPFRAPHHGASSAAMVGGSAKALPGEISLAHYGVYLRISSRYKGSMALKKVPKLGAFLQLGKAKATELSVCLIKTG